MNYINVKDGGFFDYGKIYILIQYPKLFILVCYFKLSILFQRSKPTNYMGKSF